LIPVALPPGRLRLATRPIFTGSAPMMKTMGIVSVAALAASVAAVLPGVTMAVTRRRTSSAARAGRRFILALRPAIFDRDVLTFDVTGFTQPLTECGQGSRIGRGRCAVEKTDQRDRCLLRPRQDRPADGCRAAEQGDELAASHVWMAPAWQEKM